MPLPAKFKCDLRTLSLLSFPTLSLPSLLQIHAHLLVSGAIADPFAAAKLVSAASSISNPGLRHACLLLRRLPSRSAFLYNTLIGAHVENDLPVEALALYKRMLAAGLAPNNYTFSFLLRASLAVRSLWDGRKFHAQIVRLGWESYDFVQNGLIHLYSSCGCVGSARQLFDRSPHRDVITWTSMINGYAKSGQTRTARELFDRMPERNAVSWSAMITTYAQVGEFKEALDVFNEMQRSGVWSNQAGVIGALSACGFLGALEQGKWIHAFAERSGMGLDRVLGTALIDMYAKCGCIETAWQVFDEMPERDVFAYTSMISGLSNHGQSSKAIDLFDKMQGEGVRPNEVTFICLLSACGRIGMVDRGREIFKSMKEVHGIEPGVEHYGSLVDLLGRAGLLEEAKRVITEMPMKPDSYVLGALLNACMAHEDVELGKEMVESLVSLGLDHSGVHVLLSNMYASAYRWEDVMEVRKRMEEKNVQKVPGCSMIEVDGVAREFVAGDRSHLKTSDVVLALKAMDEQMKSFGDDPRVGVFENNLDWRDTQFDH
ncbi:Pentatricopeptide repeat-containing protein [Ananas comosus]|uniref:Pentatricopeptide repeat-containing protein n=1 Tax=Ananas comosus TaxID=4615 RepID=A0A199VDI4_ANACO|nr:Pentatricopeptide repeat-containing protein [Ananas comosus]